MKLQFELLVAGALPAGGSACGALDHLRWATFGLVVITGVGGLLDRRWSNTCCAITRRKRCGTCGPLRGRPNT